MSNKENARAAWGEVRKMVGLEKSEESAAPVENKESAPADLLRFRRRLS